MRFFITLIFALIAIYFALVWSDLLPRPHWLKGEIEPLITVFSGLVSLMSLLGERKSFSLKTGKLRVDVIKSEISFYHHARLMGINESGKSRMFDVTLWIENGEERDIAINSLKLYRTNKKSKKVLGDIMYENHDSEVIDTVPSKKSKEVKVRFYIQNEKFASNEKLRLRITFVGGKRVDKYFIFKN